MPSLGLDHTWLRLPSALAGLREQSEGSVQGPSAKLALSLYSCEVEGNMATVMPWACLSFLEQRWLTMEQPGQQAVPSLLMSEEEPTLVLGLEAQRGRTRLSGYPWKLGTPQSLGFMEAAGGQGGFRGRVWSTRLLAMGMHFSFSKSQLRKYSITGREHGMGL